MEVNSESNAKYFGQKNSGGLSSSPSVSSSSNIVILKKSIFMHALAIALLFLAFALAIAPNTYAANDLMALQGNALNNGTPLNNSNLTVTIYDAPTGGSPIYNSGTDYNGAINNGRFDVMLGDGSNTLTLEYGKMYYMDMSINGVDLDFSGSERRVFQSGVGNITAPFIASGSVTSSQISDGTIVDADISGVAEINKSKISATGAWQESEIPTLSGSWAGTLNASRIVSPLLLNVNNSLYLSGYSANDFLLNDTALGGQIISLNNSKAGIGNCPSGQYVVNITTSGVECSAMSVNIDENNYTTSAGFSGAILNIAINGRSNVTATLPNDAITIDWANITNKPTIINGTAGTNGSNGLNGTPGSNGTNISISSVSWNSGNFTITWSNGNVTVSPNLTGPQGLQGLPGSAGSNGSAGTNGSNGSNGTNISISSVTWNSGNFTITWSNGNVTVSPNLTGPIGPQGPQGNAGSNGANGSAGSNGTNISISSVSWNSGNFTITWSNGNVTVSPNLTGPQGLQGVPGSAGSNGSAGTNGSNGSNGTNISITSVSWNSGNFSILWSNGNWTNSTNLTGPTGPQGTPGSPGSAGSNGSNGLNISITSVTWNSGNFSILWSNGNWTNSTNLTGPTGPQGAPGTAGSNSSWTNSTTNVWTVLDVNTTGNVKAASLNATTGFYGNINASYVQNPPWQSGSEVGNCSADQSCPNILYDTNATNFMAAGTDLWVNATGDAMTGNLSLGVYNLSANWLFAYLNASFIQNPPWLAAVPYQSNASGWYNTTSMATTSLDVNTTGNLYVSGETNLIGDTVFDASTMVYNTTTNTLSGNFSIVSTGTITIDIISPPYLINGTLYDGTSKGSARTVATAFTAGALRCSLFPVGKGFTTDGVGWIVSVLNASTATRIAFYNSTQNGYPDHLLFNTTVMPLSATGPLLNNSFGTYKFEDNKIYWACWAANVSSNARVNVIPLADVNALGITSSTTPNIGYTVAYTFTNALPSPYTAGAAYFVALGNMAVYARVRTDI